MKTDAARAYSNPDELLRALATESRDTAAAVVASVIARAEADTLAERLSAALEDTTATIADLETAAEEAAAHATAAARAVREAAGALVTLEPEIEALERGRSEENRRERAALDEVRTAAERARAEADAALNHTRGRLATARRDAAGLRDKLAALATVPEPAADALAPLVAALGGKR